MYSCYLLLCLASLFIQLVAGSVNLRALPVKGIDVILHAVQNEVHCAHQLQPARTT